MPTVDLVTPTVQTRASLTAGSWAAAPDLVAATLTRGNAPTRDQAQLYYRYGAIADTGEAMAQRNRLDLRGKFVKITATGIDEFIGYVPFEGDSRRKFSATVESGDQVFTAFGLAWFLERQYIGRTNVNGQSDAGAQWIDRAIGYNVGADDGRGITFEQRGNRSDVEGADGVFFHKINRRWGDEKPPAEWTALDIVLNLLQYQTPVDQSGVFKPLQFFLHTSSEPFLSWFKPAVKVEGRSLYDVLHEIISPKRGLTWRVATGVVGSDISILVSSMATADITMPSGGTLPDALTKTTIANPDALTAIDGPIRITRDDARKWHRVVARGARRTTTYSIHNPILDEPPCGLVLVPAWDGALEQVYADAASSSTGYGALSDEAKQVRNDRFRQSEKLSRVFRDYAIKQKVDDDFEFSSGKYLSPIIIQATGSVVGSQQVCIGGLRVLRTLPLKKGWDYTDATDPVPPEHEAIDVADDYLPPESMRPFGLYQVDGTEEGWADPNSRWVFVDRMATHEHETGDDGPGVNLEVSPLVDEYGISLRVSGGMQHTLASAAWEETTPTASPSRYPWGLGQYDPSALMIFTVCSEWDSYCEAAHPEAIPTASPVATFYLHLGERYRFDWLCFNTIFDVDELGKIKKVTTQGAIRDDRKKCEDFARLAFQWYAEDRAQVEFSYLNIVQPHALGTLITTIGTPAETVNSVVSQISYDFESGRTSVVCQYAELDFEGLA